MTKFKQAIIRMLVMMLTGIFFGFGFSIGTILFEIVREHQTCSKNRRVGKIPFLRLPIWLKITK